MDYQAAWETVTREWTFPASEAHPHNDHSRTRNRTRKNTTRDFRIAASHHIGEGSLREKALANIEAIRTLKLIETENRDATDAEKSILVRYAGWGAMRAPSDPIRRRNGSRSRTSSMNF